MHISCLSAGYGSSRTNRLKRVMLAAILIFGVSSIGTAAPTTINAVDSGRVRQSTPTENFALGNLVVQKNTSNENQSFIKFDLTGIFASEISSALLRINCIGAGAATTVKVYSCDNDSWSSASLTWNNKPAAGTQQASIAITTTGWYEADITSWVVSQFTGDKTVSIVILDDQNLNVNTQYNSAGAVDANKPKLVIEAAGEPETKTISGTVTLDGSGLAGVTMAGMPGSPVTNASGFYTGSVPVGWSGTIAPSRLGHTFTPANRSYSNVQDDQANQDYTAEIVQLEAWQYMTPNSYWSFPIQQAPVDPKSYFYIEHWKSISTTYNIQMNSANTGNFGFALYIGTASDPLWTVTNINSGEQFTFRGPANMVPSPGDGEVACIDTTQDVGNGVLYEFGGTSSWNLFGNYTGNAGFVSINYIKSNGIDGKTQRADDIRNLGHRGLPIMTFGFLVSEVQAMNVPHLVKLTVPWSGKSPFRPRENHVWPYVGNEGDTTDLPEGARVRLKASVQPRIDAMTNPYARAMAQSLLTYGSMISDQSAGGSAINIKVQTNGNSLTQWAAMGINGSSLSEFTIDDFEFVELGWTPPGM